MIFGAAANTLTYEGGIGADTLKVTGAVTDSTIYGDNASATEGGDDSISFASSASGSYIYGNLGDDSISIDKGVIASSVYGGSGKDSVWLANGASTASLIDGGCNDFLTSKLCQNIFTLGWSWRRHHYSCW